MLLILKSLSLFLVAGFFLIMQNINAQDVKLSRQQQKEVRNAQMEANFYRLDTLLNSRSFILKANYLRDSYGAKTLVVSTLNFIKVDSDEGIVQTGSNSELGFNGVGGVTAEGTIGRWEVIPSF
jgi:hypothetical protein